MKKHTHDSFIKKCIELWPSYDYSMTSYVSNNIPITVNCKKHGKFSIYPTIHIHGNKKQGCRQCSNEQKSKKLKGRLKYNTLEYFTMVKKIHNNEYVYDKSSYIDMKNPIKIKCINHGWYKANPRNHMAGSKCIKCSMGKLYKDTIKREMLFKSNGYKIISIWELDYKKIFI